MPLISFFEHEIYLEVNLALQDIGFLLELVNLFIKFPTVKLFKVVFTLFTEILLISLDPRVLLIQFLLSGQCGITTAFKVFEAGLLR